MRAFNLVIVGPQSEGQDHGEGLMVGARLEATMTAQIISLAL